MAEAPIETDAQPLQPRSIPRQETSIVPKKPLHVPPIPNDFHFNELLLEIGKHITDDVLRQIIFKYGGVFKARIRPEIQSPEDLFTILKRRRYISPENMFHIQAIVMMIDDAVAVDKLMEQIYEYSRKHKAVYFRPNTDEPPNGFKRLQFHVEGVKHYQYDANAVNNLIIRVASLTGVNIGDVLLDGIQLTHSIYVTLLIPDRHYILFSSLLKKGIPLLTELKIDMVSFEDGTTINASDGSQIVEELPPIRENPNETIQRLEKAIDELESENICYRKQIEDLTLTGVSEGTSDDLKAISRQFEESMSEAIEKHSNRQLLQRIVSLNTRLVKGLEREKMKATQKQLELWELEHKHPGMWETLKLEDDDTGVGSYDATGNREKETTVGDDREPTVIESTRSDEGEDKTNPRLLDKLNLSKERAYALGYPKQVINEIILLCDAHVRHFMTEECCVLREEIENKNALLQLARRVIEFKNGFMHQLETIFESKDETIPTNAGYNARLIGLAKNLSRRIWHEEGETLATGYHGFFLLRFFYLDNLTSDAVIFIIEDFVSKKLAMIGRADLVKDWNDAVIPMIPTEHDVNVMRRKETW